MDAQYQSVLCYHSSGKGGLGVFLGVHCMICNRENVDGAPRTLP